MLTAGIDLSVGTIFILADCLASWLVVGSPAMRALGIVCVRVTGLACGALNGALVTYGRLQPIAATIATARVGTECQRQPEIDRARLRLNLQARRPFVAVTSRA